MFNSIKTGCSLLCLFFAVSSLAGCIPLLVGAAVGAGSVAYIRGTLERNFDKSVAQLHDVTVSSLRELGLYIKEDVVRRHSARTEFEFEDGEKGTIEIEALTERSAKIKIRVGLLGDESKSKMILNVIEKNI